MTLEENKQKIESEISEFAEAIASLDKRIEELEDELIDRPVEGASPKAIVEANQLEKERKQKASAELNSALSDKQAVLVGKSSKESELEKIERQIRQRDRENIYQKLSDLGKEINQESTSLAAKLEEFADLALEGYRTSERGQSISNVEQSGANTFVSKLPMSRVSKERVDIFVKERHDSDRRRGQEKENAEKILSQ